MKKIKVLVTGAKGLVGSRFIEQAKDFEFFTPELPEFDMTDPAQVGATVSETNPDWIVNFAAFTDVNAAEKQSGDKEGSAWKVNVGGVENLLNSFRSRNFIQISTDMVFPGDVGQPGPYAETDEPAQNPENLTWYGWTKNRAEKLVSDRAGTILRIIYPVRSHFDPKPDYIRTALQKYADGKMYPLFDDQQICISFIDQISETLKKIIETNVHGVFHCASDTTTPYELISFVLDQLGADTSVIKSAAIEDFLKTQSNPNRYPVWGGLKTKITEDALDLHFYTWQTIVEFLLAQGLALPAPTVIS